MAKPIVNIGDVFEVSTPHGLAYFQYFARGRDYGDLIRAFPGLFSSRPDELGQLIEGDDQFITFFTLRPAARAGLVTFVGNFPVPLRLHEYPAMRRRAFLVKRAGEPSPWFIVHADGQETRVTQLSPEQARLPIQGIWNPAMLVERCAEGWRSEFDI